MSDQQHDQSEEQHDHEEIGLGGDAEPGPDGGVDVHDYPLRVTEYRPDHGQWWDDSVGFGWGMRKEYHDFDHLIERWKKGRELSGDKKTGHGITPTWYEPVEDAPSDVYDTPRDEETAYPCPIVALDLEEHDLGGDDPDTIEEWWRDVIGDVECWMHTTSSHGVREIREEADDGSIDVTEKWEPHHPRVRIVVPLEVPVPAQYYPDLVQWFADMMRDASGSTPVDGDTMDVTRISYTCREPHPRQEVEDWERRVDGSRLHPGELPGPAADRISKYALRKSAEETYEKQYSCNHGGLETVREAMWALGGEEIHEEVASAFELEGDHGYSERHATWWRVGRALMNEFGDGSESDAARQLWRQWVSTFSERRKYVEADCDDHWEKWDSRDPTEESEISAGTIFDWAERHGFTPPSGIQDGSLFVRGDQTEIADQVEREYVARPTHTVEATDALRDYVTDWTLDLETVGARDEYGLVRDEGQLWYYSEDREVWCQLPDHDVSRSVQALAGSRVLREGGGGDTHALRISQRDTTAVKQMMEDRPEGDDGEGFFDEWSDTILIGVEDGVLTWSPDQSDWWWIKDHHPEFRLRTRLGVEWGDREAPDTDHCECHDSLWSHYLQTSVGDEEVIRTMQQWTGMAIAGEATSIQKALLLQGDGGSGKSVFLRVLESLFPDIEGVDEKYQPTSHISPREMRQRFGLVNLQNSILNVGADIDGEWYRGTGRLKAIIAGDVLDVEPKHVDAYSIRPRSAHAFASNFWPDVSDCSRGFWDRWIPVVYDAPNFRESDRGIENLGDKIVEEELDVVVRWALEGAREVLESGGIDVAPACEAALAEWKLGSDKVAMFASHRIEESDVHGEALDELPDPNEKGDACPTTEDLYEEFDEWCDQFGYRAEGYKKWLDRMKGLGFDKKKTTEGPRRWCLTFSNRSSSSEDVIDFEEAIEGVVG